MSLILILPKSFWLYTKVDCVVEVSGVLITFIFKVKVMTKWPMSM